MGRRVSVPLRGKGRDQLDVFDLMENREKWEFPSPCGEKVGINDCERPVPEEILGFPSPCGEKVGINCRSTAQDAGTETCFRPLAGKR